MATAKGTESPSDEQAALRRVKVDLARAWFAAPGRIGELSISKAEPAHCGEFVIESTFVEREAENVDEPLDSQPTTASQPFDIWSVDWPPRSVKEISATKIDVRASYEVLACPACSQVGETKCGVCHGSGSVQDTNTHKAIRCGTCKGTGSVVCPRCYGRRNLLRFKRIVQRVESTSASIRLPSGSQVPTGTASGEFRYAEATPSGSDAAVTAALKDSASALQPLGWIPTLAQQFAGVGRPGKMPDGRPAWRAISGRWYEGWRLQCTTRGKKVDYFVPATGAKIVGPRLKSPLKIGALVGFIAALILGAVLLVSWRIDVADEENAAQQRHDAEVRAAEKAKADDAAAKAAAESKAQVAHDAEAALTARLAEADSLAQARFAKHQVQLACMGLYFTCPSGTCEKAEDYDLTTPLPDDDPVRKVPSWASTHCDRLVSEFERQRKQAVDKAAREAKAEAVKAEHYSNHCGDGHADEGVRVVAYNGVEYELIRFRQSGRSVDATIRMRATASSPADYVGINGAELTTVEDTTYNPLEPGGCIIGTMNPGEKTSCDVEWVVKAGETAKSIQVSALGGNKKLCVQDFKPL